MANDNLDQNSSEVKIRRICLDSSDEQTMKTVCDCRGRMKYEA
jgi:hypothetical protein